MPGAVPRTSTFALNNTTLRYGTTIADLGVEKAMLADECLALGLNTYGGKVTHKAVAESLELDYAPVDKVLG
jgi:alanine dehydrogenase